MVKILFCFLHFSVTVNLFLHFNNNQFGPYYFQLIINFTNGKCLHSKWCVLLAHSFSFISIFYVVSLLSSFFFIYDLSHFFFRFLSLSTWITSGLIGLFFFLIIHHEWRLLELIVTVQASTWITSCLIELFLSCCSSWMETSMAFFIVQACPSTLNAVVLGKRPSLIRSLLWNH